MRFLGGKREKINCGDRKNKGMRGLGGCGREADFSAALLTKGGERMGDPGVVGGWGEDRQRRVRRGWLSVCHPTLCDEAARMGDPEISKSSLMAGACRGELFGPDARNRR